MKKLLALVLSALVLTSLLVGCGSTESKKADVKVVTTIFPIYDWVREIAQDDADINLDLLLDNGVDLHSYQPKAEDLARVGSADLFLYVGGESDEWVEDALEAAAGKDIVTLDLMELLGDGAREEEIKEGMEAEEHEDEDGEEGPEYDEHVWLSLKNARFFVGEIAAALAGIDPDHASVYQKNAEAYANELAELDEAYRKAVGEARFDTLIFGDRFPFRYLTEDYGLDYYAAFVGCSAESEASFKTVIYLANKLDELGLGHIIKIEGGDGKLARAIVENTAAGTAAIVELDSMQSAEPADGTYLAIMQRNLEALKQALN